jgi:YbbR domain-containing protein
MRQLLTRNLGWKLLSLAIAVALWLAVAREPDLATSLSVPIAFRNIPVDLDISGALPDRVRLEVRGPTGRLSQAALSAVAVAFDLSDAQAGERSYTVRSYNVNLPAGVTFYRAVPSQITLHFDKLLSRQVPVVAAYGPTPDGYRVRDETITPAKIGVLGPQERVRIIQQVRTDPVDLSGVVGEKQFRVRVHVGDPEVRLDGPPEVTLRVQLEKIPGAK